MNTILKNYWVLMLVLLLPLPGVAMTQLANEELEAITARSGFSMLLENIDIGLSFSNFKILDTDGTSGFNAGYLTTPILKADFLATRLDKCTDLIGLGNITDYTYTGILHRPLMVDLITAPGNFDYNSDGTTDIAANQGVFQLTLPTIQIAILDLLPLQLQLVNNDTQTAISELGTLAMNSNRLEIIAGQLLLTTPSDGSQGLDFFLNDAALYWNTEEVIIQAVNGTGNRNFTLENFRFENSVGDPYTVDYGQLSLNLYTDTNNTTFAEAKIPYWEDDLYISLGQMKFCGADFGTWSMRNIQLHNDAYLRLTGGNVGLNLEMSLQFDIDSLRYEYGTGASDYNDSQNIHLAGSYSGTESQLQNPVADYYSGPLRVGDMANNKPVSFNIGSDSNGGFLEISTNSIVGEIAIESVKIGGNDFGSHVISGLNVQYLSITIPKN